MRVLTVKQNIKLWFHAVQTFFKQNIISFRSFVNRYGKNKFVTSFINFVIETNINIKLPKFNIDLIIQNMNKIKNSKKSAVFERFFFHLKKG